MRLSRATLASVLAHAALGALVVHWLVGDRARPRATAMSPEPTERAMPAEPTPIEVAYLADEPAAAAHMGTSSTRGSGSTRIETSHAPASETPAVPAPPERGPSLYMHMRGPELHFSDADADRILDHPEAPPPPVQVSGKLHDQPGGRGIIRDPVTTVTVERDGSAHFHDAPDVDIHLHLPGLRFLRYPERAWRDFKDSLADDLRTWYKDPYARVRKGPSTELPEHLQAVPGQCDQWVTASIECEPEPMPASGEGGGGLISGKLDITSYLMRKTHAGDPYASRKRALLDATFEERAAKGREFRVDQLAHSAELVRRNLERLWASVREPRERRAALFALWDECAEGEGPLGEAGERARAEVIGWIRAHLPAESADAYTPDELAAFAARRSSQQPFAPY